MADMDLTSTFDFVDNRTGRGYSGSTSSLVEQNNYDSIAELKTRLTALAASSYTAARLNTMTKNDMVYALRTLQDAAGMRAANLG